MLVRVMAYNILDGGEGREKDILQVLQAVRPDVAILPEVYHAAFLEELGRALDMAPYFPSGNQKRHVGLLSRLPIHSAQSYRLFPPIWHNVVDAQIEYRPNETFRVLGLHAFANLHIACEIWRWWEAHTILRYLGAVHTQPCLLAGDFNAVAPGDRIVTATMPRPLQWTILAQGNRVFRFSLGAYLKAGWTDCFRELHPAEDGFTLPTGHPNSRLDYILVNSSLRPRLKNCWVVREPDAVNRASDHHPVAAEFEF